MSRILTSAPRSRLALSAIPAIAAAVCSLALPAAQAAPGTFSEVSADVLSQYSWQRPQTSYAWNPSAPVTLDGSMSIDVLDSRGLPGVTQFNYSGWAEAADGRLRTYASIEVDNAVARRGNPSYTDDMGVPIPGGMPDGYSLQSLASFNDSARIQGSGVSWVQFQLRVDGSFHAANNGGNAAFLQYASVQLDQRDGNQGWQWSNTAYATRKLDFDRSNFSFSFPDQQVDMTVWSNPFKVVNGEVNFSFWLYSRAELSFYMDQWLDGGSLYGVTSDFGHTAQVVGARGLASDGSVVRIGDVIGASGTLYAAAAPVPEPANWALLAVGIAALAGLARARRRDPQH